MGTDTHIYRLKSESDRFPEAKSCRAEGCLRCEDQSAGVCCAKIEEETSFWALVKRASKLSPPPSGHTILAYFYERVLDMKWPIHKSYSQNDIYNIAPLNCEV